MKSIVAVLLVFLMFGTAFAEGNGMRPVADPVNTPDCVIVTPEKSNQKALHTALGKQIKLYIEAQTGMTVDIITDKTGPDGRFEICVGDVTRESAAAVRKELNADEYAIQSIENGIAIAGCDVIRVVHAVDLFVADVLVKNEKGGIGMPENVGIRGKLTLSPWEEQAALVGNRQRSNNMKAIKAVNGDSALSKVSGVRVVMQLAGEYSINRTRTNWNVSVADLGSMCLHNGKLYFFFGDTKGGKTGADYLYSNVVAYTTDFDYTDGITFDGYLTNEKGRVRPVTQGEFGVQARPHEFTRIPTGAVSLDGNLYMSYMSVAAWYGDDWDCNYGGIMKSADDGQTWTKLEAQWPGDSKFCQMAPVYNEKDGFVYVVGLTGGRQHSARMMRVKAADYEVFDAYEYLVGYDEAGEALWQTGEAGLYNDFSLIGGRVWEPCIVYNEYLGEWIVSYKDAAGLQLYTSSGIAGPYKLTVTVPYPHDTNAGYYGVYMHPLLTRDGGQKVAFLLSSMIPTTTGSGNIWEIQLMEMTLQRKE